MALLNERTCSMLGSSCKQEGNEQLNAIILQNPQDTEISLRFVGNQLACRQNSEISEFDVRNGKFNNNLPLICKTGLFNKWRLDGRCKNWWQFGFTNYCVYICLFMSWYCFLSSCLWYMKQNIRNVKFISFCPNLKYFIFAWNFKLFPIFIHEIYKNQLKTALFSMHTLLATKIIKRTLLVA